MARCGDAYERLKQRALAEVARDGDAAASRVYSGMTLAQEREYFAKIDEAKVELAKIEEMARAFRATATAEFKDRLQQKPEDVSEFVEELMAKAVEVQQRLLPKKIQHLFLLLLVRLDEIRANTQLPPGCVWNGVEPRRPGQDGNQDVKVQDKDFETKMEVIAMKEEAPAADTEIAMKTEAS